jgi:hypothetical protein
VSVEARAETGIDDGDDSAFVRSEVWCF